VDLQDLQELLVQRVLLVHHNQVLLLELQVQQDLQDQQVPLDQAEVVEPQVHQDQQVQLELTEQVL
jgi:hypothetical protein